MSFLENIRPFKTVDLTGFVKVFAAGKAIGWTRAELAQAMSAFDATWQLRDAGLHLNDAFSSFEARTKAVDETFMALSAAGILPLMPDYSALGGIDWFPVKSHRDAEALLSVKRFYSIYLGIGFESVIMNGYNEAFYWAGMRSQHIDAPGKLDIITAGAIRFGQTIQDALIDEANHEAGLSMQDVARAVPVGTLSLYHLNKNGFLKDEIFHLFDLNTGNEIIPHPNLPNEMEKFEKMSMPDVMKAVEEGQIFKTEINIVITDFLIRHGHLTEAHPEFSAIKTLLYQESPL